EESSLDKVTLTYYDGDDVLSDVNEKMLSSSEEMIGDALLHFGEQSEDPDIVYVRNIKLGCEYEIIRIHNSYETVVLGVKNKGKSQKKGNRKKVNNDESEGE
ncbi:MAG: hypothetical protein ACHQUC_09240, partial [Chlamydiales bacterium]